jgi:glycosyltransferase involved in cell wall biosynthesis
VLFLPLREAAANNALLEAMSSGVPVVTADRPGTREYAGDCGIYFEPDSTAHAASKLADILKDDLLRSQLGRACRERATKHFAWELIAQRHTRLYAEVLDS